MEYVEAQYPSYLVKNDTCEEESVAYQVVNLAYDTVNFIQKNPEQAKALAEAFLFIGAIGAGMLIVTCIFENLT